jgi:hypothetical protein
MTTKKPSTEDRSKINKEKEPEKEKQPVLEEEFGGTDGPEPTRYGDWENGGRCSDF